MGTAVQLGLHFWPASSLIYGIRVDYLSPTLYALDIGIIISLFLAYLQNHNIIRSNYPLSLFYLIAASNLIFSQTPLQSLLWWLHLGLYLCWASTISLKWLQDHVKWLLIPLASLSCLGLAQIIHGGSFQGIFYWLGERRINISQPGIALQELFGVRYLRAYSLFSHPNIFAGWAVFSVLIISFFDKSKIIKVFSCLLGVVIIFLTASRSGALGLLAILFMMTFRKPTQKISQNLIYFILGVASISYLVLVRSESVIIPRLNLISISFGIVQKYPVFGVGALGSLSVYQFISPAIRYLQPDHFSPTLLLSWLGFVGIIQLIIVSRYFNKAHILLKTLFPLLPIFLLDHYLLTSFSGMLIVVLAFRSSYLLTQLD